MPTNSHINCIVGTQYLSKSTSELIQMFNKKISDLYRFFAAYFLLQTYRSYVQDRELLLPSIP